MRSPNVVKLEESIRYSKQTKRIKKLTSSVLPSNIPFHWYALFPENEHKKELIGKTVFL